MGLRFVYSFCFFSTILIIVSGCSNPSKDNKSSDFKNNENLCRYSKWLKIFVSGESAFVTMTHPETGMEKHFVIGQEPIIDSKSAWLSPKSKIAALSATHIGMLGKIDATNFITAVSSSKLIYNDKVRLRLKKKQIFELGDEGQINIDRIVKSQAKVLVYSAFGGDFPQSEQIKKIGITCVPNYDWRETHPLGKAEWLLLFGFLTGKEKMAFAAFKTIEKEYLATKNKVKNSKGTRVMAGNLAGDIWYTPAGESYFATLMKDAGMDYLHKKSKGNGSLSLSMEQVLMESNDCELWLNPGFATKDDLQNANIKVQFLQPYKKGEIACYAFNMNRFWEESAVNPHLLLQDLYLMNLSDFSPEKLTFYRLVK